MKHKILAAVTAACVMASGSASALSTLSMTNFQISNFSIDGSPVTSSSISTGGSLVYFNGVGDTLPGANASEVLDPLDYAIVSNYSGLLPDTKLSGMTSPGGNDSSYVQTATVWNFTLAPGMGIVFSADFSYSTTHPNSNYYNAAKLEIDATDSITDNEHIAYSNIPLTQRAQSAHFSTNIINTGTTVETGILRGSMGMYEVGVVPEPASIVMLLAGLGVLGFTGRRRRG